MLHKIKPLARARTPLERLEGGAELPRSVPLSPHT
jgi:hypothetical protein